MPDEDNYWQQILLIVALFVVSTVAYNAGFAHGEYKRTHYEQLK